MNYSTITKRIENLVAKAAFDLRADVKLLLNKAYKKEKSPRAKQALRWIIDNAGIAKSKKLAICQDTGLPVAFIQAGKDVSINSKLIEAIEKGIASGYKKHSLRASTVDPLNRKKPSYKDVITHVEFSPKKKGITITLFPKGFGSENKSKLNMFNPTASIDEIEKFIIESVKLAGPESCPPFIVGVGIGGTSDKVLLLAKEAMLERVDRSNPDKKLKALEKRLLERINKLKIGPMGFGGTNTALAVKVKTSSTHIAGLPVGVNISCHALRSATIKL